MRNWGAVTQVYKGDPSLQNIYQAWGAYKFNAKNKLAVGRMELDYDNVRILGNLDWAAQGRSHDLVKYEYSSESGLKFHFGAAFNQDANTPEFGKLASTFYGVAGNYKTMQFAWLHKNWENTGLSFLVLNNGVQAADSSVNFSQTTGFYGTSKLGEVALEYDAYYQFGKNAAGADLSAYMFGINATFWKAKPTSLTIGVDYLSGNKTNTAKDESFNPLYGTHHKFYGFMDYFYVGNPHANKGLVDAFAKAKFKTGEKSSLLAQAHEFLSQSTVVSESLEDMSSTLGTELDLVYVLKPAPEVTLNIGYSHLFYTESMEIIKGSTDPKAAYWAWAMISIKPTLFTTKKAE